MASRGQDRRDAAFHNSLGARRCHASLRATLRECGPVRCVATVVLLAMVVFAVARNKFLMFRVAYVKAGHALAVNVRSATFDPSEGGLYASIEAAGYAIPDSGCVWDIGAHDGVFFSNSFHLLHAHNYTGFLFEPDPSNFLALQEVYREPGFAARVDLHNFGVHVKPQLATFRTFPLGFENTISKRKDDQYDSDLENNRYKTQMAGVDLVCKQQARALKQGRCGRAGHTVLSIDVEGAAFTDAMFEVIKEAGCVFDLVIAEMGPLLPGYATLLNAGYNHVFACNAAAPSAATQAACLHPKALPAELADSISAAEAQAAESRDREADRRARAKARADARESRGEERNTFGKKARLRNARKRMDWEGKGAAAAAALEAGAVR